MAARTKTEIVAEARRIARPYVQLKSGEHSGATDIEADGSTTTPQRTVIALLLLIVELLSNIRQNETNP